MKRNALALTMAAVLALALGGCAPAAPAATPTRTPGPALPTQAPPATAVPTIELGPTPAPAWEETEETFEMTAPDGAVVFTYTSRRLRIRNETASPAYRTINEFYEPGLSDYRSYADAALADYEAAKGRDGSFAVHTVEEDSQLTFQNDRVASLLRTVYSYTGGSYPETYYTGDTLDLTTGARMGLGELFSVEPERWRSALLEQVKALGKLRVLEDGTPVISDEVLEREFREENFYLSEEGIVIYYQGGELPHAIGVQEFTVPYEQLKELMVPWES